MKCVRIISLKRKKDKTEYLKYYLFPGKLVGQSSNSSKLTEYKFADEAAVEKKLNKILDRKVKIGFEIVNRHIAPIFYNQFNEAMKAFDAIFKNETGINWQIARIKDSDNNSFLRYFSLIEKKYLIENFHGNENLINLFSTFNNFEFRINLHRHGMQYRYRCTIMYWDQTRWYEDEPYDKYNSALGKSIINFISENDKLKNQHFWSRIKNLMTGPEDLKKRYHFFTKGLMSVLDTKTEKVYSVMDYEPNYNQPVKADEIIVHNNTVDYMSYVWNRLIEDVFYSMEYK